MRQLGILQIILSGIFFGLLGIFGKSAYSHGLSPGEFLGFRFVFAALILGAWRYAGRQASAISPKEKFRAFLLGALGYAVFSSCFFIALQGLSVSLTFLLLYLYPVWVTAGAIFFLGERLTKWHLIALPVALCGLALLLWGEMKVRDPAYLGFGVASSIFYAAYVLSSRKTLQGVSPLASSFYVILGAGTVLGILHLRSLPTEPLLWGVILGTAFLSTVLPIGLFLAGLQKLNGAEAAMLSLVEPCTAVLIGVLVFGDSMLPPQWAGAALIFAALVLVAQAKRSSS